MRVMYVTSWVMGDSGANAAEIFPRLSAQNTEIEKVIVADFPKNKFLIQDKIGAEFLKLLRRRGVILHALRIARKTKQERIDIIHIFYRQQNAALLIALRLAMALLGVQAKLIMDHRSVNLAKGWKLTQKMWVNQVMQRFTHHLAGNPWAVETNHYKIHKPKHIIDLGYDQLPQSEAREPRCLANQINVWFIGSLKPRNRKSAFLFEVFDRVAEKHEKAFLNGAPRIKIHIAGPTRRGQAMRLRANPHVFYYGKLPRHELYELLRRKPGLGLAYMNHEYHEYAPSLKFAEYAAMRYGIIASDTIGLKTQAERMNLSNIRFVPEDVEAWADAIIEMAMSYKGLEPLWDDAESWSYPNIYHRQVMSLYKEIIQK
jgi:hypothetical protein